MDTTTPRRRNTPEEMIEVLQAHAAGKPVERRNAGASSLAEWAEPAGAPRFNFALNQYRVKPEPKSYFLVVTSNGALMYGSSTKAVAERQAGYAPVERGARVIEVREVQA